MMRKLHALGESLPAKPSISKHACLLVRIPFIYKVEVDLYVAYRTLSIHVTDTVEYGLPAAKGHVKDISELEWHKIAAHEAARRLRVNESQGLDENQAERRLREQGKNTLSPPPKHRVRKMYLSPLDRFSLTLD
jgi:Cation transporter/ATPase, N-terminus